MSVILRTKDGSPAWVSSSIVPSRDKVVSSASGPHLATVQVNSADVFVYVNVENPGTVDLGLCPCSAQLPAAWARAPAFSGFLDSTTQSPTDTRGAFVFHASPGGDSSLVPESTRTYLLGTDAASEAGARTSVGYNTSWR